MQMVEKMLQTPSDPAGARSPADAAFAAKFAPEGLTFDDVLLVPSASSVLPKDVDLRTRLTRDIRLYPSSPTPTAVRNTRRTATSTSVRTARCAPRSDGPGCAGITRWPSRSGRASNESASRAASSRPEPRRAERSSGGSTGTTHRGCTAASSTSRPSSGNSSTRKRHNHRPPDGEMPTRHPHHQRPRHPRRRHHHRPTPPSPPTRPQPRLPTPTKMNKTRTQPGVRALPMS